MKEECIWLQRFGCIAEAETAISRWIDTYNTYRPHESLGWMSPTEWRESKKQAA